MELAAQAFALGVAGGEAFLSSADPARLLALRAAVERAYELRADLHDHLALRIIARLAEGLSD